MQTSQTGKGWSARVLKLCVKSRHGSQRVERTEPVYLWRLDWVEEAVKDASGLFSEPSDLMLIKVPGSFKRIHPKGSAHLLTPFPFYFNHLATISAKVYSLTAGGVTCGRAGVVAWQTSSFTSRVSSR